MEGADDLLTVEQVSGITKRSMSTIYDDLKRGRFAGALRLGQHWRIPRSALDNFLEEARREADRLVESRREAS